ncbi:MAG: PQQ-binding-like beta-propeller repeat protein, partial [Chloroflexia bacterium]|nr:PQQ-binding-like beta-propeller repeat protein [Chloroflexia bacterium]
MAATNWTCTTCGQRVPETRRFCVGCGMPMEASRSGLARTAQTQFTLPDYLLAARERESVGGRRSRATEESSGGGLLLIGAAAAAGALIFSALSNVGLGLLGAGLLAMLAGLWRMRVDSSTLERVGWLVALAGLVALGSVGFQVFGPVDSRRSLGPSPSEEAAETSAVAEVARAVPAPLGASPMFRGDAAHSGVQPGPAVANGPATRWRAYLGGEVYSSPVVADGRLFVGTKSGFLVALDVDDGLEQWRADLGGYVTRSTPVVVDDTVFAASGYAVFAFAAADGQERWRAPIRFAGSASPTYADGVLYVPTQEGNIFAF